MPGCWPSCAAATWCRRSGCPTRRCAPSASGRAFGSNLVKHRSSLKAAHPPDAGRLRAPIPVTDLFGAEGRRRLAQMALPDPWRLDVEASLALIDDLEGSIGQIERELRELGAEHEYVPLLKTAPARRGCSATRSPPRSATSTASPRRPSS